MFYLEHLYGVCDLALEHLFASVICLGLNWILRTGDTFDSPTTEARRLLHQLGGPSAEPLFIRLISCAAGGRLPRTTNPRPQAAGADMSGCRVDWA